MTPLSIPLTSIVEGTRARQSTNYGDLTWIKNSIRSVGQIQDILLDRRSDGLFNLIAGGRRFRCAREEGISVLQHNTLLVPGVYSFSFVDEVPEHIRLEAELEENIHRLDMEWSDIALAIYNTHRAKKSADVQWKKQDTAFAFGKTAGVTGQYLRAAKALIAGDKEILECKTLDAAVCVFTKRKEDEALKLLQERNAARLGSVVAAMPTPAPSAIGSLIDEDFSNLTVSKTISATETRVPVRIPLSSMFTCGDSINDDTPWPLVDHIVTDIPYGIDMSNLDEDMVKDVASTHSVQSNIDDMPRFLAKAFAATKPRGFCVFCFDLVHFEKLMTWAVATGWRVQRWPVIAHKTSACRNQAAQYNTTKNYESIMYLRKDEQTVLRRAVTSSVRSYDFAAERKMYNNPFAKPFALWKDIYEDIAFPGQSVFDPYAGEMSAPKAAINCGLLPYAREIDEKHFLRGLEHIKAAYALVHKSNVEFI